MVLKPLKRISPVVQELEDGDFLTADTFKRRMREISRKVHSNGMTIALGASSDRPMLVVEDIDIANESHVDEAVPIEIGEATAQWSDIQILMRATQAAFVICEVKQPDDEEDGCEFDDEDPDNEDSLEQLVLVRVHERYDRSGIEALLRLSAKRREDSGARWTRLEAHMSGTQDDVKTIQSQYNRGQTALMEAVQLAHHELKAKLDILIEATPIA